MNYPFAQRVLEKWRTERLERLEDEEDLQCYRFRFEGSTCTNGGEPFSARFHMKVDKDAIIRKAWIEIPDDSRKGACQMCASPSGDIEEARDFLKSFEKDADFINRALEETVLEEWDLNHAGCLCRRPMINQKWKMVLSTVHYDRNQD